MAARKVNGVPGAGGVSKTPPAPTDAREKKKKRRIRTQYNHRMMTAREK